MAASAESLPMKQQHDGFVRIRVAGSPYEMGLQHGELLREEIRDLMGAINRHVLYGMPGIVGMGTRRAVRTMVSLMHGHIPRRHRAEMAGVARAADLPYQDVVLINCFDDVLANLRLLGEMFGRLGCSAFAVTAERKPGELVCGRNLDYFVQSAKGDDVWAATNYMREHVAVIEFAPSDHASFLTVGWPGFIGAATAQSERGMVTSALTVSIHRNRPYATPSNFVYRRIMEEASTLEDAVHIIRRSQRTQGNNLLVGSGTEGTAMVTEYTPSRLAVRRPVDGWIATTNHFNHPHLHGHTTPIPYESSTERYCRLGEMCVATEDPDDVLDFGAFLINLERRDPELNEYCSVLTPCTLYSTLFAPAQGRLWVRIGDRADRTFDEVRLSSAVAA